MQMGMLALIGAYRSLQHRVLQHLHLTKFFFAFLNINSGQAGFFSFFCDSDFLNYEDVPRRGDDSIESGRWKLAYRWCLQANHQACHQAGSSS